MNLYSRPEATGPPCRGKFRWSQIPDLNGKPSDYKSGALPVGANLAQKFASYIVGIEPTPDPFRGPLWPIKLSRTFLPVGISESPWD